MSNEGRDQWNSDGDCSRCRRELYCSKPCTANKKAIRAYINKRILEKTFEVLSKQEENKNECEEM